MTWFKVDDTLAFHDKVVRAGNSAMGLWVRAGSWCSQQLTDGFVPDHMVGVLGSPAQARRLVAAGLWTRGADGYWFHEFTEKNRNPSRAEILRRREKEAEKKAKARAVKSGESQVKDSRPQGTPEGHPQGAPEGVRPIPSRPDPSRKEEETPSGVSRTRTRARGGNPANVSLSELAETAHVPQARRIVTDWCQRHGVNYPTRTLRALGKEVDRLLTDRGEPDVIATALDLWHQRADAGPGLLPHLYVDALKTHHGASSGRSTRDDKIQGWRALAENPDAVLPATDRDDKINGWLRLVDEIDDERPDLRAVEGGRTA